MSSFVQSPPLNSRVRGVVESVKSAPSSLKVASVLDDSEIPFFVASPPDFDFHMCSGAEFVLLVFHVRGVSPGNFSSTFARVPLSS